MEPRENDFRRCQFEPLPTGFSERLGLMLERLGRVAATQEELLQELRALSRQLHPSELDRRDRALLEAFAKGLGAAHDQLERKIAIRLLSATGLFGFVVYLVQMVVK